jgi:UDP-N-acetylmuramate dehydrogenase
VTHEHFDRRLRELFGDARVNRKVPLAPLTTFKIGGPADWLVDVHGEEEIRAALEASADAAVPVLVLGGGSNLLVADAGVRGLVLRARGGQVVQVAADRIRAHAGVTINGLVRWTLVAGQAGLEAWAGTPGTVGGAIHGNAHFRGRPIGDLVAGTMVVTRDGQVRELATEAMEFGYDYSRLQRTGEVLVWADFLVSPGDTPSLRAVARESLAFRKRTQPLASPSAGCIFQNPDPARDRVPDGIPCSAGALVDRAGLKGVAVGRARVSTTHGNFIVNEGGASAADVRSLIGICKARVSEAFGVELREEIVYAGFEQEAES